jgi:hypothetical protein
MSPQSCRRACCFAVVLGFGLAAAAAATRVETIPATERFQLQSRLWLSLHQTLMEAAQRDGVPNPGADAAERADWDAAVASYRERIGDRDPVRDRELIALDEALSRLPDDGRPSALPYDAHVGLSRAYAVYFNRLWPQHSRGNQLWIAVASALLEQVGDELAEAHQEVYGAAYPRLAVVDVTPYGGRYGAYTNDLTFPHAIIGSRVPGNQGFAALESIFHEVSHSVVRPHGDTVGREIDLAGQRLGRTPHPQLWHAIQFHVTGELVRRALAARGVSYTPMVTGRLWEGPFRGLQQAVTEGMAPRLEGRGTLQEAIDTIVERTAPPAAAQQP